MNEARAGDRVVLSGGVGGGGGGGGASVGGGEGVISDQGTEVLGEAFQSIAQSMGHMVEGIRAIEMKMELTDQAVRSLAQGLKIQGQRMLKLEQRINVLEQNLLQPTPSDELMSHEASNSICITEFPPTTSNSNVNTQLSAECSSAVKSSGVLAAVDANGSSVSRSISCTTCSQMAPPTRLCGADRCALGRCLLAAAHDGRTEDVLKLLNAGADVNFPNSSRWTPLHRAATKAHPDVVSLLLKRGADVNARNSYGFTALHMAACNDFKGRCAQMLIDGGSDLDSRNRSGRTPLHSAAERGNVLVVRSLVLGGASRSARDAEGRTPFDVAKSQYVRRFLSCAY